MKPRGSGASLATRLLLYVSLSGKHLLLALIMIRVIRSSLGYRETVYTLLPEDYIIGPASGNPDICLAWPRAAPPSADGIDWQFG